MCKTIPVPKFSAGGGGDEGPLAYPVIVNQARPVAFWSP